MKFDITYTKAVTWSRRLAEEWLARRMPHVQRQVLLVLPSFRGRDGICPSYEAIVARVGRVSRKTVERALMTARELGILAWERRRAAGRRGRRFWSSNLYLLLPDAPRVLEVRMRPQGRGSTMRPSDAIPDEESKKVPEPAPSRVRSATDLLTRRQRQFALGQIRPAGVSQQGKLIGQFRETAGITPM